MLLIPCNHCQYLDVDGFILRTAALRVEVMKLYTTREILLSLRIFLSLVMLEKYNGFFHVHREWVVRIQIVI